MGFGQIGEGSILPTFTAKLQKSNIKFRCLKDSGCQGNFVSEKFAKNNNLKIVKNDVSLVVHGFNGSKHYNSNLVELNIELGQRNYNLLAFTIPSINIKLNIPGLREVVKNFTNAGYRLADQSLIELNTDILSEFEFILGTDSSHCLLYSLKLITCPSSLINPSVIAESDIGVILMGNAHLLKLNSQNLNSSSVFVCSTEFSNLKSEDKVKVKLK